MGASDGASAVRERNLAAAGGWGMAGGYGRRGMRGSRVLVGG